MKWKKKGFIYKPDKTLDWSTTHAQVPIADFIEENNTIKIYFSTRDHSGRSLPNYVLLNADNPKEVLEVGKEPILRLGELGTFDDCGVMPSWLVNRENGAKWLYYIGWNIRDTIPYHNSVGLAISSDNGNSFQKFSEGPLWIEIIMSLNIQNFLCDIR